MRTKREWTAKLLRQHLLQAAKRGARTLILRAVKDTWVRRLKNTTACYNKPPPPDLTDHLAENRRGIEYIDVVALQQAMKNWWREDPRMPEYVNRIEDVQKKAARAYLHISD